MEIDASPSNVIVFSFVLLVFCAIVYFCYGLISQITDFNNASRAMIPFFRSVGVSCTVFLLIESFLICIQEGFRLFFSFHRSIFLFIIIPMHLLLLFQLGMMFLARVYFTFKGTSYAYSNRFYKCLVGYFFGLILLIFVIVILEELQFVPVAITATLLVAITGIFLLSINGVVLLFVHIMTKVKCVENCRKFFSYKTKLLCNAHTHLVLALVFDCVYLVCLLFLSSFCENFKTPSPYIEST